MEDITSYYKIIPDPKDSKKWFVRLTDKAGMFSGLFYSYGKVEFVNPTENTPPILRFERDILYVPRQLEGVQFSEENKKYFETLLGRILYDIIDKNLLKTKESDTNKLILEVGNDQ